MMMVKKHKKKLTCFHCFWRLLDVFFFAPGHPSSPTDSRLRGRGGDVWSQKTNIQITLVDQRLQRLQTTDQ